MNACTPYLVMLEATLQVASGGDSMTRTRFMLIVEDWAAQARQGAFAVVTGDGSHAPTTSGQGNGEPCESASSSVEALGGRRRRVC